MKINIRAKIRYKGQEFSDPSQLPPEVRVAYEKAMAGSGATPSKIVINGEELVSGTVVSRDARQLYDDIMSVVENNGHVTLPIAPRDALLTKWQVRVLVLAGGALATIGLLILAHRAG